MEMMNPNPVPDNQEYTFRIRRLATEYAVSKGIRVKPKRFSLEAYDYDNFVLVRALVDLATQEEELCKYPDSWWQAFKERYFPRWLLKRCPVRYTEVWAYHKYPELEVPDLGKEIIHLKAIRYDDLGKLRKI